MKRYLLTLCLCLVLALFIGCTPGPLVPADLSAPISVTRMATPTATPLPTLQPRPPYILSEAPAAAAVVGWNDYANAPNPSMICVELTLATVVEPGDHLMRHEIVERTTLFVNGEQANKYPEPRKYTTVVNGEVVVLDSILLVETVGQIVDSDGQVIASWEGEEDDYCWLAELLPGTHQAEFQFRQTSGTIHSYRWYFTLTEP
jgi:hypothetical protein